MTAIFCVDDSFGLSFCGKRLSTDSKLRQRAVDVFGKIYMKEYTLSQFSDNADSAVLTDSFDKCDGACFIEFLKDIPKTEKIDKIVLYRWNRRYPSTEKFDTALLEKFTLTSTCDFTGTSHDKITEEVYE